MTDYAHSGLVIQYAMLDHFKKFPDKNRRPPFILWDGKQIFTADRIPVPSKGRIRTEFITSKSDTEQGFDLSINGYLKLVNGEKIKTFRTWNDPRYESAVEYPFMSKDGLILAYNVYKMVYPGGQIVGEKWTGNAGFWIEVMNENERIYHCSHGMAIRPDFESLVFRVTVQR